MLSYWSLYFFSPRSTARVQLFCKTQGKDLSSVSFVLLTVFQLSSFFSRMKDSSEKFLTNFLLVADVFRVWHLKNHFWISLFVHERSTQAVINSTNFTFKIEGYFSAVKHLSKEFKGSHNLHMQSKRVFILTLKVLYHLY